MWRAGALRGLGLLEYAVAGAALVASTGTLGMRVPMQKLALTVNECQTGAGSTGDRV